MKRFGYSIMGLVFTLASLSCGKDGSGGGLPGLETLVKELAGQCGIACPGDTLDGVKVKGVVDGNAAISGVPSVDAFFGAVINFQNAATNVSSGMEAQLNLIRGDFGIAANEDLNAKLKAQFDANLEGGVVFQYQPARCAVDAGATVQAQARCEGSVTPPKAMVECKGSCEVQASASVKCDADVDLQCSFTGPTVDCQGSCQGTCEAELKAAASCSGTCRGSCSGNCSAYSDSAGTKCAGSCDAMCMGTCEAKVEASAKCMGTCRGECTVTNPSGGCMGAAHAECKAKANASVMCEGKCEGEITPPMAKAECQASAKAEAHVNVQCTPPKLELSYKLKAKTGADLVAQAKFEGALKGLVNVRLPALLQASARADSIATAGEDLVVAAGAAVKGSFDTLAKADASVKAKFGVTCAFNELPKVDDAIKTSNERLTMDLMEVKDVKSACGLPM
jgi:hypothetical protein